MSSSSRRHGRLLGAAAAGLALLLVPAGFTAAHAAHNAPVSGLQVVEDLDAPAGELTFVWNASSSANVVGYEVEADTQPFNNSAEYTDFIGPDEALEVTLDGLEPGQPVKFTVRTVGVNAEEVEEAGQPVSVVANTLGDVNEDGTFFDTVGNNFEYEIAWLATNGITTGYDDGTYRPSQAVLREQMAAFIFRLVGDSGYEAPEYSPFTDVPTTHTFYREISWMGENGISTGYANGDGTRSFAPAQPVLREQMAAFLFRAGTGFGGSFYSFLYSHGSDPASFTDVPRSSVFFDAIEFMALANITTGYKEANGTLTFRPSQPVLREQMAAFLYRLIGTVYSDAISPEFVEGESFEVEPIPGS